VNGEFFMVEQSVADSCSTRENRQRGTSLGEADDLSHERLMI